MSAEQRTPSRSKSGAKATGDVLLRRFDEVRSTTEALCEGLSPEDCVVQSMPEASPIKWHLAHTSWFFETFVLVPNVAGYRPFHPEFSYLFNSYYNAVGERVERAKRGMITRPSLAEVMSYRRHVDEHVRGIGSLPSDVERVIELGCHHEQQHQELILTDLKHLLSLNPLQPAFRARARAPLLERDAAPARFIAHAEGLREIGHAGGGFAFDNESPRHRVFVEAFELAARPVTNGEYRAFIADHGYERPELWLSDGWDTVASQAWRAPLYWKEHGGTWRVFTLSGERDLDPAEPVCHVSYYEADAYARWANARLPREAEWEVAARELAVEGNFVEAGALHPQATGIAALHPQATRIAALHPQATGIAELHPRAPATTSRSSHAGSRASASNDLSAMFGDVWEWTQSAYDAYPGYRPAEGALGEYNGKFMVNQMVLRGGSCASPRAHVRATYRNFFHPSARWQFSGIRLARDA